MDSSSLTAQGRYLMLALDHRGSFLKLINSDNPDQVTLEQAIDLKRKIINSVVDQASGLLIDFDYGLPAFRSLNKTKNFLLPIERSGYASEGQERLTSLEQTADTIKDSGASGVKLLIYFNPHVTSADRQIATAKQALDQAHSAGLPLFLEIVTYTPDGTDELKNRADLIIKSLRSFIDKNVVPDVWKLEYPSNQDGCQKVSKIVGQTPWILLTRGETFEVFKQQLAEAVSSGARGFLAGRALWQEAPTFTGARLDQFFTNTLPARFKQIVDVSGI